MGVLVTSLVPLMSPNLPPCPGPIHPCQWAPPSWRCTHRLQCPSLNCPPGPRLLCPVEIPQQEPETPFPFYYAAFPSGSSSLQSKSMGEAAQGS